VILVLSCEHGGNKIPGEYFSIFEGKKALLKTHRAYDPGTLDLFLELQDIAHFSKSNEVSRLLVECNRSLHHPKLFSDLTDSLDIASKQHILQKYYYSYRNPIEEAIANAINTGETVLHLSLHSFVPELNGEIRNCDIGLLYDSKRFQEKHFCKSFKKMISNADPQLKIRSNYPYLGNADGFTTYLRKRFQKNYLGIELEINQKLLKNEKFPKALKIQIKRILKQLIY
jgi:predicted N-formylglutamate amidohydrolase